MNFSFLNHDTDGLLTFYSFPTGTSTELPCEPGYYSNTAGLSDKNQCQPCPGGKYCAGLGYTRAQYVLLMYVLVIVSECCDSNGVFLPEGGRDTN